MQEVTVEGEDFPGVEFIGHLDQAGIGKIRGSVSVFCEEGLNRAMAMA
jgi:hypothetical protein